MHGKHPKKPNIFGFSGLLYTKKPVCSIKNGKNVEERDRGLGARD
jgi:hypothetical protein